MHDIIISETKGSIGGDGYSAFKITLKVTGQQYCDKKIDAIRAYREFDRVNLWRAKQFVHDGSPVCISFDEARDAFVYMRNVTRILAPFNLQLEVVSV